MLYGVAEKLFSEPLYRGRLSFLQDTETEPGSVSDPMNRRWVDAQHCLPGSPMLASNPAGTPSFPLARPTPLALSPRSITGARAICGTKLALRQSGLYVLNS